MLTSDARPNGADDEASLRRWAREHHVPLPERSLSWPGYVLDEMRRMDEAALDSEKNQPTTCGSELRIDGSQAPFGVPKLLLRVGTVPNSMLASSSATEKIE